MSENTTTAEVMNSGDDSVDNAFKKIKDTCVNDARDFDNARKLRLYNRSLAYIRGLKAGLE